MYPKINTMRGTLNGNPNITWEYSEFQDTLYIRLSQDFDATFYDEIDSSPGVFLRYTLDDEQRFVGITVEQIARRLNASHPDAPALGALASDLVAQFAPPDPSHGQS
ncbi:MAG: DUF2283 domain-containing protein [Anaerolineaceae bacterium]|nr:DUF2283 domain-containing protein [Anaerolineaceae bacterium]